MLWYLSGTAMANQYVSFTPINTNLQVRIKVQWLHLTSKMLKVDGLVIQKSKSLP